MAIARLQAAADLEVTPIYQQGKLAEIKVRVKNIRAGHNLPTSLTNVRQMWLEIKAMDEKGNLLFASGTIDDAVDIADVEIWEDVDASGSLTGPDLPLGSSGSGFPANDGTLVIALIEGRDAVVKRFFKRGRRVELVSANESRPPLVLDGRAVRVQGIVVGLLRRYR